MTTGELTRREALKGLAAAIGTASATGLLSACTAKTPEQVIVVYCSVDADVARPIFDAFSRSSGVRVDAVFDTEATKTTGLVNRLLGEKKRPRADVWWSSEPLGTIRLAKAGVLERFTTVHELDMARGWWPAMRSGDGTWYAHARRLRVLAYNTGFVKSADVPRSLADLTDERWRGRVGIARPAFGTTRGQMAALLSVHGEPSMERWLNALKTNRVRLYDGNASVTRAVGSGELLVGLADNDDVVSGKANSWPIEQVAISNQISPGVASGAPGAFPGGAMQVPCTVARIRGGPAGALGAKLADHLLSAEVEKVLTGSVFQTYPTREPARGTDGLLKRDLLGREWMAISELNFERISEADEAAQALCAKVLG